MIESLSSHLLVVQSNTPTQYKFRHILYGVAPCQNIQKGSLAGATRPNDGHKFTRFDIAGIVIENLMFHGTCFIFNIGAVKC